jgi:methylmalonyl-CoA mutase N-terminal domain/subunit
MGGMLPAIERGFPQAEIAEASYRYQTEVNRGEQVIVGVNRFQAADEEKVDTLDIDESVQARQVEKLSALRRRRDAEQVRRALERLSEGAEGRGNLMPLLLDSVKSYATLGEIVTILKRVFGTYSETSVL